MTTREVLEAAKAKVAEPEHWCQGARARAASGRPVYCTPDRTSPLAVQFCAEGAIVTAARETGQFGYLHFVRLVQDVIDGQLPEFNDGHAHPAVLAAFDRAIARAS